jgi:TolA-binding protein
VSDESNESAVHPMNGDSEMMDANHGVQPSDTPIQERLKKAYIDKYNSLKVSDMTPEQVKFHIADLEDAIKILQTQLQATMDVDDEWAETATSEEREKLRAADKKYRAKARPAMNADGTIKTAKPREAKPVVVGDAGSQAFENLVNKLVAAGQTREMAVKLIQGMKGTK